MERTCHANVALHLYLQESKNPKAIRHLWLLSVKLVAITRSCSTYIGQRSRTALITCLIACVCYGIRWRGGPMLFLLETDPEVESSIEQEEDDRIEQSTL